MSSNTPESQGPEESGGLESMLERIQGMLGGSEEAKPEQTDDESGESSETEQPSTDDSEATPSIPRATPVTPADSGTDVPKAQPVPPTATPPGVPQATPVNPADPGKTVEIPALQPTPHTAPPSAPPSATPVEPSAPTPAPETGAMPAVVDCPICGTTRAGASLYCHDCGYHFSDSEVAVVSGGGNGSASPNPTPGERLQDRFEIGALVNERMGVSRFKGLDHSVDPPTPVYILRGAKPIPAEPEPVEPETPPVEEEEDDDEMLPSFDDVLVSPTPEVTEVLPERPQWPSVTWEHDLLRSLENPALPSVVASFQDETHDYLVEEIPTGTALWDAWDDPDTTTRQRYGWLAQVADALHALHLCQCMVEGLRPDIVVISEDGQARLTEMTDLLPLPLPPTAPIRGTLYTAPELMSGQGKVDARADLYSFGAMIYALHVGRELSDIDFERPGHPKPFIPQFPDIHPTFGRLMSKTFRREPNSRFPTDEAVKEDGTGFLELIKVLNVLGRTLDIARLEIASWTNTGMVRTGNEDGFALIHTTEARQDDLGETALILLCDGMGGYEAGEVAAALSIQHLRDILLANPMFRGVSGKSPFPTDPMEGTPPTGHAAEPLDVEACKEVIKAALRETNKRVVEAGKASGNKRRAMGCTAEVVFVDGTNIVVGHVGDSRTYHLHEGRLAQMTRDQTLVNRLVELGTLTPEEAENHPRRNELQQAIGGQPDVDVGLYSATLLPGDWIVVCSDGLNGHVKDRTIQEMLFAEAWSAETAARRLVNLTNIEGATDNVTVVALRAT